MKRKFAFALLTITLVLLILTPTGYATWTLQEETGYWELDQRTNFKSGWDDDHCVLAYATTVGNFTAWTLNVNGEIIQDAQWITTYWHTCLAVTGATGQEYRIQLDNWRDVGINFFGAAMTFQGSGIQFWSSENETWKFVDGASVMVNWVVRIFRSGNTTLTLQAEGYVAPENCAVNAEIKLTVPEAWFTNVELYIEQVEESASIFFGLMNGQIRGNITNEQVLTNLPPLNFTLQNKQQWQKTILDTVWQALTGAFKPFQPVSDFLGQLWQFLTFAGQFLGTMFTHATMFIPLIVSIFGFWLVFFVLENLMDFNLKPVTEMFIAIYQFFANLINMFVSVAQAIYDYIKFW